MPGQSCLTPQQFTNLLVSQLPVYSPEILRDIRPTDGLAGHISVGQWDPFAGVQQTKDRFRNVKANTTKKWEDVSETTCVGSPCDPTENEIGWGWDRITFGQQRQSWKSQLLCFDQEISATKAVEHIGQIVSDILRPATQDINSMYVRKKSLDLAGNKILADASMTPFTFTWSTIGNEEIYLTPSAFPTSKLTPEMIQRQLPKMRWMGYFGKWTNDPFFGGYDQYAELITDDDTVWSMDRVSTNQNIANLWRFTQWNDAHDYYKYGMGGSIGNFMTHVDPFCLRFNKVGNKLQVVLPSKNVDATVGIGNTWNTDYDNAQYQVSFIWHRFAWKLKVQQLAQINSMMPFLVRGLNGEWRFAMNDLGSDCDGNPIANYRQNKGFFYADFRYGAEPSYTEWMTAILHMREPLPFYVVAPCAADPGYPTQDYNSANDSCDTTYFWEPDANGSGHYVLSADTVTCNDEPVANGAIDSASLAALVTDLNNDAELGALGTWSTSEGKLWLTGATCRPFLPWVTA